MSAINESGVSIRTARRWIQAFRKDGLVGLVRSRRVDFESSKTPKSVRELVEGLALSLPRHSKASIHRRAMKFAEELGLKPPSYTTIRAIISRLGLPLRHLAHEGKKSFMDKYDLVYRRTATRPNEIWQADHTALDILLVDPKERPTRPWLTVVLDDHSRAVCGYLIGFDAPCAINTALTLHQAIWRKAEPGWNVCGIPDKFYTDHGSDFTSQHMEQVSADIRMQLIFSTVAVPRGRGKMERFFGSVNQLFLSDLPGYTGGGGVVEAAMSLAQLDQLFRHWLLNDYHTKSHGETGQAPQNHWEKSGFLPRMPESLAQLDLLLLTVARPRTIHPDGVHFQGFRYMSATLAAYVREPVTIRYDPRDLAQIRVFHEEKFLCIATCGELSGTTTSLKDITRARNQQRRELTKLIKDKRSVIGDFLAVHVPVPPSIPPALPTETTTQVRLLRTYEND